MDSYGELALYSYIAPTLVQNARNSGIVRTSFQLQTSQYDET